MVPLFYSKPIHHLKSFFMPSHFSVSFHFDEDIYTSLVTVDFGDGDNMSFFVNLGNERLDHVLPFRSSSGSDSDPEETNRIKADLAFDMVLCISDSISKFLSTVEAPAKVG